eukprot:TRINITY_DN21600_c0_g2_i1.p1 TRINITY_DN21600_c0_g2~~TRINITY_DN21600_c0_g2_i1.p1  ORF type:complete len:764 (+),score=106.23 TRINITY_DN21600_c0_g2_i1:66-2294(+)
MTCIACALAVSVLRLRYPVIYQANAKEREGLGPGPAMPSSTPLGWLHAACRLTVSDVCHYSGLDHGMLVEFQHLAMRITVAIGVPSLLILAPIHSEFGDALAEDEFSHLSLGNVRQGSWILWLHVFFVWYVVIAVHVLLLKAQHHQFLPRRRQWLEDLPSSRACTVLVEGIPEKSRSSDKLAAMFDDTFGFSVVKEVAFAKDTSKLMPFIAKRKEVEYTMQQRERNLEKVEPQLLKEYANACLAVTAIREEIRGSDSYALNAAFVTFVDRRQAEFARGITYSFGPDKYEVSFPPEPSDVNFSSFEKPFKQPLRQAGAELTGRALVTSLFFAFLPVVAGISAILSDEHLSEYVPHFRSFAESHPALAAIWNGLVGNLALAALMCLVPAALSQTFLRCFRMTSFGLLQSKIQEWYFFFLIVFVLLVTAIGSSLFQRARTLAERPPEVLMILAETLPGSTNFYLTWAALQCANPFVDLTRHQNLRRYFVAEKVALLTQGSINEREIRLQAEPESQNYHGIGARSARSTLQLSVAITLCSLQPAVTILSLIGFACNRLAFSYLPVFAETHKADWGGIYWQRQLHHVQLAVVIHIVLMSGVLLQLGSNNIQALVSASSLLAVVFFRNYYQEMLHARMLPMIPERKTGSQVQSNVIGRPRDLTSDGSPCKRQSLYSYVQPELLDEEETVEQSRSSKMQKELKTPDADDQDIVSPDSVNFLEPMRSTHKSPKKSTHATNCLKSCPGFFG